MMMKPSWSKNWISSPKKRVARTVNQKRSRLACQGKRVLRYSRQVVMSSAPKRPAQVRYTASVPLVSPNGRPPGKRKVRLGTSRLMSRVVRTAVPAKITYFCLGRQSRKALVVPARAQTDSSSTSVGRLASGMLAAKKSENSQTIDTTSAATSQDAWFFSGRRRICGRIKMPA
jgi:hypothetical protein